MPSLSWHWVKAIRIIYKEPTDLIHSPHTIKKFTLYVISYPPEQCWGAGGGEGEVFLAAMKANGSNAH